MDRLVSSVAELNALPDRTVIHAVIWWADDPPTAVEKFQGLWWAAGEETPVYDEQIFKRFPVTVLYVPGDELS